MSTIALEKAWTGGQYSFVRAAAAVTIAGLLTRSAFSPDGFSVFSASLVVAALALAVGIGGRAFVIVFATLFDFGSGDAFDWTTVSIASLWLFLHLGLSPAPYGSLLARGRQDPVGNWSMPAWYPVCFQALFVLSRLYSGMSATMDGNEVLAAAFVVPGVLALGRRSALLAWSLSLGVEVTLALSGNGTLAGAGLLHLLTFQPAWIPRRDSDDLATVFYDGTCALCHGVVRFLLAEDPDPPRFRLAPLAGPTFLKRIPERVRVGRPDSIVVIQGDVVLVRGTAALAVMDALGGIWGGLAAVLGVLPQGVIDAGYDFVASRRYRWFGRKTESCPLMTAAQRARFDE